MRYFFYSGKTKDGKVFSGIFETNNLIEPTKLFDELANKLKRDLGTKIHIENLNEIHSREVKHEHNTNP